MEPSGVCRNGSRLFPLFAGVKDQEFVPINRTIGAAKVRDELLGEPIQKSGAAIEFRVCPPTVAKTVCAF
jgi:hypothetical protein